ncbi:putative uncharacterized protein MRGPRG-AS1 [Macaca thibetana thibetana]|uniref:putative uncharacterized protein MRGPRG-AS1 n=1 Tax=Macaca thibetana thibetana TaxID=257877 RepID=UPI0021BC4420|nr:putative uncharacterized protein MRGPRG-AS1 [Macaca thibetana thibetana]
MDWASKITSVTPVSSLWSSRRVPAGCPAPSIVAHGFETHSTARVAQGHLLPPRLPALPQMPALAGLRDLSRRGSTSSLRSLSRPVSTSPSKPSLPASCLGETSSISINFVGSSGPLQSPGSRGTHRGRPPAWVPPGRLAIGGGMGSSASATVRKVKSFDPSQILKPGKAPSFYPR